MSSDLRAHLDLPARSSRRRKRCPPAICRDGRSEDRGTDRAGSASAGSCSPDNGRRKWRSGKG
eukprot:1150420-Pleurochrysis_carterae.AAC.1